MNTNATARIAYVLLTANRPLTTKEICERAKCERKSVYTGIDVLECSGFITTKEKVSIGGCIGNVYTCKLSE